ncbi:MAG: RNA polymerase sigma factor [Bacteroidales bacterium]
MTEREFNKYLSKSWKSLIYFAEGFIKKDSALTAEDMVQESAVKLWNEKKEIKNVNGFMKTVLKNVCLDYLKSAATSKKDSLEDNNYLPTNSNVSKEYETKESLEQVNKIIKKLPYNQQVVIKLRDIIGYEYSEIAEILSTSETNIRVLLSRARKELRKELLR